MKDEKIDNEINSLVNQLKDSNSNNKQLQHPDSNVPLTPEEVEAFVVQNSAKLITHGLEVMDNVKDYIIENIQQEGIDAFAQFAPKELGLTTKEAIAEHIGEAHKTIKTRKGDFERPIMPQAGGAGTDQDTVNNLLKKGRR